MALSLLVSNLINIRYLTGVEMTFGIMIMENTKRTLFVDQRYIEKAKNGARSGIRILPIEALPEYLKKRKRIRFEAEDVSVARLQRWKKRYRGIEWIPAENVIEGMRRRKRKEELKAIGGACRITDAVLKNVPKMLKIGMSEKMLAWEIEKLSRTLGADAMAFDTIVGFGSHTARPHHSPTDRKLKKHDIIQIDMGVKVDGYCSDCSRVFFLGKKTEEQKKIFDLLVRTVNETTKQVKAGMTNHALDKYARSMLRRGAPLGRPGEKMMTLTSGKKLDEFFTHGLGHGVGLEIHEGANLSKRAPKQILQANEVITIEPGIYFPGKWGMRIEDTILVKKTGAIALTRAKKI
ncbi:MAG TPA: aminopeptidase P family protein [Candidatus Peribacterales bacterium]|nr:aminopeptidase P family protein [Candidatus Peribacterales bacterium]